MARGFVVGWRRFRSKMQPVNKVFIKNEEFLISEELKNVINIHSSFLFL